MIFDLLKLIQQALERRTSLLEKLHAEQTDCYRLFHGTAEGHSGLTIDRYGPLILMQTFREALFPEERNVLENFLCNRFPIAPLFVYNHRGKQSVQSFDEWHCPSEDALAEVRCQEFGISYLIRARHQGIDPWLFLDLRTGRRVLREMVKGQSVLNLFSYTCSAGVSAARAGAGEVWNVDFASSNLEVGRRNAALNAVVQPDTKTLENHFRTIQEDCYPVMRQLAGLSVGVRGKQMKEFKRFDQRHFDLVFLDPPAWSKGHFGAVDVVRDYASLFKPAVLIARPNGGHIIATHHVAHVNVESWENSLKSCAIKAGKPLRSIQMIQPESDFPSFDGRHPLKIAICEVER
jgi:23S rRNA (cytosine1962-C5)-methyltransferase